MIARLLAIVLAASACVSSSSVQCGDHVCPGGDVCTAGGCASPGDIAACMGAPDGMPCTTASNVSGTCSDGVCRAGLCGNGAIDNGEACDDGNQVSGDGCRNDCRKVEACDGKPDDNEACDDGNMNPADGCDACTATTWSASALVGSAITSSTIELQYPEGLAIDNAGRIYYFASNKVWRVDLDGVVTRIAGNGIYGYTGDGGSATNAEIGFIGGIAIDGFGRVLLADLAFDRLRRIDENGVITTIAGTGYGLAQGTDSGLATAMSLVPFDVAVDDAGQIFISDRDNCVVWKLDDAGTLSRVAGTFFSCAYSDGAGDPLAASFKPSGIAYDPSSGALYVAADGRVVQIHSGVFATIAGNGTPGFSSDGAAMSVLVAPQGLAVAPDGGILFADPTTHRIRRLFSGVVTTLVGDGSIGTTGDNGPGAAATVSDPWGIDVDAQGRVVFGDIFNTTLRRIDTDATHTITSIVGSGAFGDGAAVRGATSYALLNAFGPAAVDAQGRMYVVDTFAATVWRAELDGSLNRVAGTGQWGFSGDGGLATRAWLQGPQGVAIDSQGRLVIADTANNAIRRVDASGVISTIAGTPPSNGYDGDGIATQVKLNNPTAVAIDSQDRIYIVDSVSCIVRRLDTNGMITRIAGVAGSCADSADGAAATSSTLSAPIALALDSANRVLIVDQGAAKIRRIASNGTFETVAGNGTPGYAEDGVQATSTEINATGVAVDATGQIVIADRDNNRVRRVALDGVISTIVGDVVSSANLGDGGPATNATIISPNSVAVVGNSILITELDRVRRIQNGTITTVLGLVDPPTTGGASSARLADPQQLLVAPEFTLVAAGSSGTVEMLKAGSVTMVAGRYKQATATGSLARFGANYFGDVGGIAYDAGAHKIYISEHVPGSITGDQIDVIDLVDPADPMTWTIAQLITGLAKPAGLYLDTAAQKLYIAESAHHDIRELSLGSMAITTFVNATNQLGFAGDDGPAAAARLYLPTALTRCPNGDLFIADTGNNRVRRIDAAGTITTVAGTGEAASTGDGQPAAFLPLDQPRGVACDDFGNVYVTSSSTVRVILANDGHVVDGTGPIETIYGEPPRSTFPASTAQCLTGIAAVGPTTVQVTDACSGLLVQLQRGPAGP